MPEVNAATPLAASETPRPAFQLTRRLVGATRWPLFLLTAIYALNVADQFVVPTLFPLLKQEFGLSDTALGVLSSLPRRGHPGHGAVRHSRRPAAPHPDHRLGHGGWGLDDDLDRARPQLRVPARRAVALGAWPTRATTPRRSR